MSLDPIAELVRRAAVDSGVVHALRFSPEALRAPLGLSQAQVQALRGADAFPLPTASPRNAAVQPAKRAVASTVASRAVALDVTTVGTTLLPPEGDGPPPGPDTQVGGGPAPSPRPAPAPTPAPTPSQPSPQPGKSPTPGIPGVPGQPSPQPFGAPSPVFPIPRSPSHGSRPGLSPMPVLRQPSGLARSPQQTSATGPTMAGDECAAELSSEQALEIAAAAARTGANCSCSCCISMLAVVANVTTTAQTAMTAIVALAQMKARA